MVTMRQFYRPTCSQEGHADGVERTLVATTLTHEWFKGNTYVCGERRREIHREKNTARGAVSAFGNLEKFGSFGAIFLQLFCYNFFSSTCGEQRQLTPPRGGLTLLSWSLRLSDAASPSRVLFTDFSDPGLKLA